MYCHSNRSLLLPITISNITMNANHGNDIITIAINMIMATIRYNTSARTIYNTIRSNISIIIIIELTMTCINSLAITINITSTNTDTSISTMTMIMTLTMTMT